MAYFDAVLFDVDGTLIHSSPGILKTMEYTFARMGFHPPEAELKKYVGPPLRATFGQYCDTEAQVEWAVDTYRDQYRREGQFLCELFPDVMELLNHLHDAGVLMCTATSKPVAVVEPMLQRLGVHHLFRMIGGATMDASLDTKEKVIRSVIHQPFMKNRRILMVGDRKDDVIGGCACGLPVAGVLYGYGSRTELEQAGECHLVQTCSQLFDYILCGPDGSAAQEVDS